MSSFFLVLNMGRKGACRLAMAWRARSPKDRNVVRLNGVGKLAIIIAFVMAGPSL